MNQMACISSDTTEDVDQKLNQTEVNVAEPSEDQPIALIPNKQPSRLKWTIDVNEYLLRSYFLITIKNYTEE